MGCCRCPTVPPPQGCTGYDGMDPSYADLQTWADDPADNLGDGDLALRLHYGLIEIDGDH